MDISLHWMHWGIPTIALGVSFLFSMLGLGGGQLYVPLFWWLGMDLKLQAIPLALLLNFSTQLSATTTYVRAELVEIRAAIPLVITLLLFPPLGAIFTRFVSGRFILAVFAMLLFIAAAQALAKWKPGKGRLDLHSKTLVGLGAGAAIGILVGFLGRGGGTLVVPTLLVLGFEQKGASATSSFVVAFSALSGFLGHLALSNMDWILGISAGIAAFAGAQMGSRLMAHKLNDRTLRWIFAMVLTVIGIKLIVDLL